MANLQSTLAFRTPRYHGRSLYLRTKSRSLAKARGLIANDSRYYGITETFEVPK